MKKIDNKGFTLIEVVLVLAIGGLIFLLAFIAFQQVSKNRRDTQRRADAGRIVAEIQNYLGDVKTVPLVVTEQAGTADNQGICADGVLAGGIFPDFNMFSKAYLCKDGKFYSPSNKNYTVTVNTGTLLTDQVRYTTVYVLSPTTPITLCDGSSTNSKSAYKVEIGLESGLACRDSR